MSLTEQDQEQAVLGVDPVPYYAPLLETAGSAIDSYKESAGWAHRVSATFGAVMEAMPTLSDEMGEAAPFDRAG